jgi:hypothetical protein
VPPPRPSRPPVSARIALVAAPLLAIGAAGGFLSVGSARAEPAPRAVLVELAGSLSCEDCPEARAAIALLEGELGRTRVLAVELHADPPLATADGDERLAAYGDPVPSTVLFDGGSTVSGALPVDAYRRRLEERLAVPSPLAIEAIFLFDGATGRGEVTIDVEVVDEPGIPDAAAWTIRAFVLEDGVPACCGADGSDRWDRVLRRALPEAPLLVSAPGESREIVHALPLDPAWDPDRLGLVAFVQRDSDGEVLNAFRGLDAGSLPPVPAFPLDTSRARLLPIVPNPLRSESRIPFTMPAAARARVTVHDGTGRLVRVLTDDVRPPGLHPLFWNGTDWRGKRMANGVYFVRLETPRGVDSAKLVVLR